jgi:hypothetical protein
MTLDPGVMALVLLAAALHASWNALVKAGGDRLAVLAITMGAPSLLLWLALPFVPAPAVAAWPYLFASVVVHTAYYACLIHAYRHGEAPGPWPARR